MASARGHESRATFSRGTVAWLAGACLVALAVMVALRALLGEADWTEGEGVYGLTARALLHGGDLYGRVVVAQPPLTVLAGAAALGVHDSLGALRDGMSVLQLCSAALCGRIVWCLTRSWPAAVITPAVSLLTPWAVHENSALLPETVAMPLLLGSALLASRPGRSAAAGALAATAVFAKYPMVVPLVFVGLAARDRRRYFVAAIVVGLALAALFSLAFGAGDMWHDTVAAQSDAPLRSAHLLGTIALQGTWNTGLVVALAVLAVVLRDRALEPALFRTSAALAAGVTVTALTMIHTGTGLYVLTTVELACVPLAVCAGVWSLRSARRNVGVIALGATSALLLWQSISLIAGPRDPGVFDRPGAPAGYGASATTAQVRALVARARRCPPRLAYSGAPYIAFIANRPMPDDQPDTYIIYHSSHLLAVGRAAQHDQPRCP